MIIVCLPFKNTFNKTEIKYGTNTTSYALRILTLIGFSVSSICLILLLITYGLFQELRTVPGMNLMNLSLSMLLSHLTWLIGTSHFTGTKTCTVLAILEHYIFHVSFVAMYVISYHSCYVFSQPFAGLKSCQQILAEVYQVFSIRVASACHICRNLCHFGQK